MCQDCFLSWMRFTSVEELLAERSCLVLSVCWAGHHIIWGSVLRISYLVWIQCLLASVWELILSYYISLTSISKSVSSSCSEIVLNLVSSSCFRFYLNDTYSHFFFVLISHFFGLFVHLFCDSLSGFLLLFDFWQILIDDVLCFS